VTYEYFKVNVLQEFYFKSSRKIKDFYSKQEKVLKGVCPCCTSQCVYLVNHVGIET